MRHKVVAYCYDKRGRLISRASNSYKKTHPLQKHFANLVGRPEAEYLHAEIAALLRTNDRPIHHIHIERFDKQGNPALAKPCSICEAAIKAYGVKTVSYTE